MKKSSRIILVVIIFVLAVFKVYYVYDLYVEYKIENEKIQTLPMP